MRPGPREIKAGKRVEGREIAAETGALNRKIEQCPAAQVVEDLPQPPIYPNEQRIFRAQHRERCVRRTEYFLLRLLRVVVISGGVD